MFRLKWSMALVCEFEHQSLVGPRPDGPSAASHDASLQVDEKDNTSTATMSTTTTTAAAERFQRHVQVERSFNDLLSTLISFGWLRVTMVTES